MIIQSPKSLTLKFLNVIEYCTVSELSRQRLFICPVFSEILFVDAVCAVEDDGKTKDQSIFCGTASRESFFF